ncbi:MAG: ABC transporter permease [Bacteroidales bacterium]|nr:ABC transporter permease [Bacteroidales bacterium]
MNIFKVAWRNIWRNRSRTVITVLAIVVAVFLSTVMTSMQEGTYSKMIDNVVKFYSGYIQVHHPDYWKNKNINNTFYPTDSLLHTIQNTSGITDVEVRLESFTLLSTGNQTKGAALIGINPVAENKLTNLSHWIESGKYLEPGDDGILIAYNLAKNIDAKVGDTIVLISQGYHGASAAGLFPVRGILKFASPTLNNFGAYIDLGQARNFYSAYGLATSVVIMIDDDNNTNSVKRDLQNKLGDNYGIQTWDEMQPEIKQMIQADRSGGVIMKAILYLIIGFGIFGTVIMMVSERKRELGVMVAVGMQKTRLALILLLETLYLGIVGVLTGFAISIPIIAAFVRNPIPLPAEMAEAYETFGLEAAMYFSAEGIIFIRQIIIVFIITMLIGLYPVMKAKNLKLSNSLRA